MKYFFIPVLLFHTLSLVAQKTGNSFEKYSYSILGFNMGRPAFGTGFFIRKNKGIYLVTALHVINGCNVKGVKNDFMPDITNVLIKSNKEKPVCNLDVTNIKKIPCFDTRYKADVAIIKIDSVWEPYINSVEGFIKKPYSKKYGAAMIWGYPMLSYWQNNQFDFDPPISHVKLEKDSFKIYTPVDSKGEPDSINYLFARTCVKRNDTLSGGYSGSPVFLQYKKTKKWEIIGMVIQTGNNYTGHEEIILVRFEQILKKLDELIAETK